MKTEKQHQNYIFHVLQDYYDVKINYLYMRAAANE